MARAYELVFSESKRLPNDGVLEGVGIVYDAGLQLFKARNDQSGTGFPLKEFIDDYYKLDLDAFKRKFSNVIGCTIDDRGYVLYQGKKLPIRDLAFFANKANKFANELQQGRERGNWVKTVSKDINITTSQIDIITDFIDQTIKDETLNGSDIIMLKYLKRLDQERCTVFKIFSNIDVKDTKSLISRLNTYADGFFGQNEDYSEDIDRLELDIIKALQGGCQKRELKTNDATKRIVHPKSSNNNCFFKCIQPFIPQLRDKIIKSECNKIRISFGISEDDRIAVQSALNIFKFYSKGKNGLEIWSNDLIIGEVPVLSQK